MEALGIGGRLEIQRRRWRLLPVACPFFSPAALLLEVEEQALLQHQLILQADLDLAAAEASEVTYAAWKAAREPCSPSFLPINVRPDRHITGPCGGTRLRRRKSMREAAGRAGNRPDVVGRRWSVETANGQAGGASARRSRSLGVDRSRCRCRCDKDCGGYPWTTRRLDRRGSPGCRCHGQRGCSRIQDRGEPQPAQAKANSAARLPCSSNWMRGSLVEGTVDLAFHEDTSDLVGWTVVHSDGPRVRGDVRKIHCAGEGLFRSGKRGDGFASAGHHSCVLMTR